MKRVLTAVVLIPLVLWLVLKGPEWALVLTAGLIAVLATREYLSILVRYGLEPFRPIVLFFVILLFALALRESLQSGFTHPSALSYYLPVMALTFGVLLFRAMFLPDLKTSLPSAVLAGFSIVYVGFPLFLIAESVMPYDVIGPLNGRLEVVAVLMLVWVSDIAAYLVGRTMGQRLLAPRISPKKTWEGAVGSMIGALLVAYGIWSYGRTSVWLGGHDLHYWLLLGAAVNIAAQVGDLAESLMKRGAGMKDSGSLLPGHGGVLDRIDALLFAIPVMWYFPRLYSFFRNLIFA